MLFTYVHEFSTEGEACMPGTQIAGRIVPFL
jgi:hypothetical protein